MSTGPLLVAVTIVYAFNILLTAMIKLKYVTKKTKRYNISMAGVMWDFVFSVVVVILSKVIDDFVLPFDGDHFVKFTSSIILFSEFISILKKFSIFTKNKMYSQISNVLDVRRKRIIQTNH
jgi:ABC-type Mn2+/Zn2+ transport system permease subunit